MPSGCGESEDTRKNTAAIVLLSKTMTDYLNYLTHFIGQAIISAVVQYLPQACSINSLSALKTKPVLMQLSCLVKAPGFIHCRALQKRSSKSDSFSKMAKYLKVHVQILDKFYCLAVCVWECLSPF